MGMTMVVYHTVASIACIHAALVRLQVMAHGQQLLGRNVWQVGSHAGSSKVDGDTESLDSSVQVIMTTARLPSPVGNRTCRCAPWVLHKLAPQTHLDGSRSWVMVLT